MIDVSKVIRDAITSHINAIHTSTPARIIAVNDDNTVDVKPLISVKQGGKFRQLPILQGVPFLTSSIGLSGLFLRPSVGDDVLVVFTESNIDNYLANRNYSTSSDARRFSLNDGFAIMGISDYKIDDGIGVTLRYKNASIDLNDDSQVVLNGGSDSAVSWDKFNTEMTKLKADVSTAITALGGTIVHTSNFDLCKVEDIKL